jgi:hypothetical protein
MRTNRRWETATGDDVRAHLMLSLHLSHTSPPKTKAQPAPREVGRGMMRIDVCEDNSRCAEWEVRVEGRGGGGGKRDEIPSLRRNALWLASSH